MSRPILPAPDRIESTAEYRPLLPRVDSSTKEENSPENDIEVVIGSDLLPPAYSSSRTKRTHCRVIERIRHYATRPIPAWILLPIALVLSTVVFLPTLIDLRSLSLPEVLTVPHIANSSATPAPSPAETITPIPTETLHSDASLPPPPPSYIIPNYASTITRPASPKFDASKVEIIVDDEDGHSPGWVLTDDPSRLPECEKIFLFVPASRFGFGSMMNFIVRAATLAASVNATFLIDSGPWIYGPWDNYFEPLQISCNPPADWWATKGVGNKNIGEKGWEDSKRIYLHSTLLEDLYIIEKHVKPHAQLVQDLRDKEFGHGIRKGILPADESLPAALVEVFEWESSVVKRIWKPVKPVLDDLENLKLAMGIGKGQPTIGLHLRLGDKSHEYKKLLAMSNVKNTFGNLTAYLEAAHDAYDDMALAGGRPNIPIHSVTEPSTILSFNSTIPRPTLLVITAEQDGLERLARDQLAAPFRFDRSPVIELPQGSFSQGAFIDLPLKERVAHTRQLVRDITLMANEVDHSVVTGSSNVGRLTMLLAGTDAMLGPKNAQGERPGIGRIRSIDVWWYPTAHPRHIWEVIGLKR